MLDTALLKHTAEFLGSLDRDRTYQHRLSRCVRFLNLVADCEKFLFLGLVYRIMQVLTDNRLIGRNLHNVHSIDCPELFFLSQCRTGHTGFFIIFIEEILERDICKSLAFPFYFYVLFCLNCLMKSIRVTTTWHNTSGKLINDKYLVIFYHIILIAEHQVIGAKCQLHIVLNLQILRICQVLDLEELLYLLDTISCQMNDLIFLIDDEVSGLLDLLTHDGIHLGKFLACLTTGQRMCHIIAQLIKLSGFSALTRDDQRSSRLIDQNRVNLVDDGIM